MLNELQWIDENNTQLTTTSEITDNERKYSLTTAAQKMKKQGIVKFSNPKIS